MKIDYSKWTFHLTGPSWGPTCRLYNAELNISIHVGNLDKIKNGENPAKAIKEKMKEEIQNWYIQDQLTKWIDKTIPVEDNLDYIENEAERRGLDV